MLTPMDLLTRDQWDALLALGWPMRLPAVGVFLHHSVTIFDDDGSYAATGDVAADMREIERVGGQRFARFSYSYCGHPSGWIGEGAGLTIGAHTADRNSTTFGYCLIGNYDQDPVTDAQVRAFGEWRAWMVANGWLAADHWVEPHRAVKATACPGANTMARWAELVAPPLAPSPPPPVDWAAIGRFVENEHAHQTSGGPPVYMYAHDNTYHTDGVDPAGNLRHKWWTGTGWGDDIIAGPASPEGPEKRTKTAADPSAPVMWQLGMFGVPDRIDVQVRAADGHGLVHAHYTPAESWHSEIIPL